ncbi:TolC family outer membrane protein [Methylocystis echinoides]|uniref:Channel protein TolC n=1 Tax=Methylocystis echinoides TaxID=29468 RepID=A0A9W6GVY9_9HYPH|nr:TolC family outer membrane protein [Methylocystis echinoides]GLI94034.1 channel protein TolC [Methylocystis echinoides]
MTAVLLGHVWSLASVSALRAETINDALVKVYNNNPEIDEQRANVRVRDEDVSKAYSNARPKASISATAGPQRTYIRAPAGMDQFSSRRYQSDKYSGDPVNGNFQLQFPVFDGGKTRGALSQAESAVLAARANLYDMEQQALLKGATAYLNVLRDTAVVRLKKNNILVLREQLRVTSDRYHFGEVTRTDVAQAESALAEAQSDLAAAFGALENSMSVYVQVVGDEPKVLKPAPSLDAYLPALRDEAIAIALAEHPSVVAGFHQIDAASAAVKVAESVVLPTASIGAQVIQQYDSYFGYPKTRQFGAQIIGTLNVPLYQGGSEYSSIRQSKEQLGQARLHVDVVRNAVRAAVIQAFSQFTTAKAAVSFGMKAVKAAEVALQGVRDEAAFGQRTTLDVLNAQQLLLDARVKLVTAQRDKVVGSYAVLASIGRLSYATLNLDVTPYDPAIHLEQVRNKWVGFATPEWK